MLVVALVGVVALGGPSVAASEYSSIFEASPVRSGSPAPSNSGLACDQSEYLRLTTGQIRAALTDKTVVYDWNGGAIYRAVISERFLRWRNRYRVHYDMVTGGGTWSAARGQLCTREYGQGSVCRRAFRSERCGYAFSEPGGNAATYHVSIRD